MSLRGIVAQRLIHERGGPGSGAQPGHPPTNVTGVGLKFGGPTTGSSDTGPMSMSDTMSGLVVGEPVDLSAAATEEPTELDASDIEAYLDGHADDLSEAESHVLLQYDPKSKKVIAIPVKFTSPSASDTSTASRTLPEPVVPLVEFAQVNRRSSLFPRHWGDVPFVPEVRHRWILENCRTDSHGSASKLIELRSRYFQLSIRARRFGPGE